MHADPKAGSLGRWEACRLIHGWYCRIDLRRWPASEGILTISRTLVWSREMGVVVVIVVDGSKLRKLGLVRVGCGLRSWQKVIALTSTHVSITWSLGYAIICRWYPYFAIDIQVQKSVTQGRLYQRELWCLTRYLLRCCPQVGNNSSTSFTHLNPHHHQVSLTALLVW